MWQIILEYLQLALPSGFLGAVAAYLFFPRVRKAKERKNEESIYKMMYSDLRLEILDLQKEYQQMNFRLHTIERKIYEAARCTHFSRDCPMFDILQEQGVHATDAEVRPKRSCGLDGCAEQTSEDGQQEN